MSESKQPTALRALIRVAIAFIVFFDVAFLWQKLGGAYESELGSHPEEATHCVTGIFMRDVAVAAWNYARTGFQGAPEDFARDYARKFASHYPKVALGSMPPGFHFVEGIWTVAFGTSRFSFLVLIAFLAGLTATILFEAIRRYFSMWAAAAAGLLWVCAPFVRKQYVMVMPDTLCVLTLLGSTLAWGRYMDEGRKSDALWFGLLAAASLLTKSTGLAVLPMCVISVVIGGRWRLLARPSLWITMLLLIALAGIWMWALRHRLLGLGGWAGVQPNWDFTKEAAPFHGLALARALGFGTAFFAVVGLIANFRKSGAWMAHASLVLSVWLFHAIVPAPLETRHVLPATPAMLFLAIGGIFAIARHRRVVSADEAVQKRREYLWVVLLVLLAVPQFAVSPVSKSHNGFAGIVLELLQTAPANARVLVSSDKLGEGMFIAEVAMRDERPNMIIERSTVELVEPKSTIIEGRQAKPRFGDDAAVLDYIARSKIDFVLLDRAIPELTRAIYHEQLQRVVESNAGIFGLPVENPIRRHNEDLFPPLRLYPVVRDRLR